MHVCTSHQKDNNASTQPLSFLQAGCLSCRPTNSVKALKTAVDSTNNANLMFVQIDQIKRLWKTANFDLINAVKGGVYYNYGLFCAAAYQMD